MTPDPTIDPAIDLTNLAALIAAAPEEMPPTPEEITAETARELRKRQNTALSELTGWGARYLAAVATPPTGAAWIAAFALAADRIQRGGLLVLYGNRGAGKTRMAAELAVIAGNSRYRTAMKVFLDIRATFRKTSTVSEAEIIADLTRTELLILDEIQERGETAFEDRLLTHIIDARYAALKPTVLITNLPKRELAASLGKSIVDRARENGKSIEFDWPSYRAINHESP